MQRPLLSLTLFLISSVTAQGAARQSDIQLCVGKGDADQRIAACSRAIRDGGPRPFVVYNGRAIAFSAKGELDRAIADYSEAIRLDATGGSIPLNGRGQAWRRKGEYDKAIADFDKAIRIDAKNTFAYAGRGDSYALKGEFDRALADYAAAIKIDPKYVTPYNNRASFRIARGEFELAIRDYDEAIKLNPKFAKAWANRGSAWQAKGDLDRAIADQTKAISLDPKDVLGFVARGSTYRYKGEYEKAFADFDAALQVRPDAITAYTGKGLTYEKIGDLARARIEFGKALNSSSQERSHDNTSALETARTRIAAIDSGEVQPVIPAAPSKAATTTSIPTQVAIPKTLTQAAPSQSRRVALVIGNSAYKHVPALRNPQNDASSIAKSLRLIGFETVTLVNDATREKMIDALRQFANEAESADWAMVYYAGHGIEVGGVNYLVPVDAKLKVDRDIEFEAVPLSQILRATDAAKKIKLVMLDACRDNPFKPRKTDAPEAIARSATAGGFIASRSTNGRGLAEVKIQGATLVVYAAKDGQVALDGEGGNSPFAVAVVQRLATPGVEINKMFRLVRDDVMEATAGRQEPYTYGSLPGREDFYFVAK